MEIKLYKSHEIVSPMIMGLFRPKMLVPSAINTKDSEFIFSHEFVHLKRKDILFKLLIFLATAIHWFNPIVHLMQKLCYEDIEISADERVVKNFSESEKIDYGKSLLNEAMLNLKSPAVTTNFGGGKKIMKKRIDKILNKINLKSGKLLILILSLTVGISIFFVGCEKSYSTNFKDQSETNSNGEENYDYLSDEEEMEVNNQTFFLRPIYPRITKNFLNDLKEGHETSFFNRDDVFYRFKERIDPEKNPKFLDIKENSDGSGIYRLQYANGSIHNALLTQNQVDVGEEKVNIWVVSDYYEEGRLRLPPKMPPKSIICYDKDLKIFYIRKGESVEDPETAKKTLTEEKRANPTDEELKDLLEEEQTVEEIYEEVEKNKYPLHITNYYAEPGMRAVYDFDGYIDNIIAPGEILLIVDGIVPRHNYALMNEGKPYISLMHTALNCGYEFEEKESEISVKNEEKEMFFNIGSSEYKINAQSKKMEMKPIIKEGKIYLSVEDTAKIFGKNVEWDENTLTVKID